VEDEEKVRPPNPRGRPFTLWENGRDGLGAMYSQRLRCVFDAVAQRSVVLFLDEKNQKSRLYRFFNGDERRKTGNPINSLWTFAFHSICFGYLALGVAFGFR